ncbi:MAG: DUF4136 domain-containing protein [Pseudomonadota bacterium]
MKISNAHWLVLFFLSMTTACASGSSDTKTHSNYDHQFDFAGVRSVYIEPSSRTDPATIEISDAQIARIDEAISSELTRKGFKVEGASREADLLLTWTLNPRDLVSAKPSASDCDGCDMAVDGGERYSKGTLIVDMVDPIRNQAVWRTDMDVELYANPGSDRAAQAWATATSAMFANFPPQ